MKKKFSYAIKLLTVLLLNIYILSSLSGCFLFNFTYKYSGEYKELYTVAIYSIPDADGYMYHGEGAYNSDIYVWEQDDYGRVLFAYCEDYQNSVFNIVISQGYNEKSVWFYPEVNYISTYIKSEYLYEHVEKEHLKNMTEDLYNNRSAELKKANDWGKPVDIKKCVSYDVVDHKVFEPNPFKLTEEKCKQILIDYSNTLNLPNPEGNPYRLHSVLQVDKDGKTLHKICGLHRNYDNQNNTLYIILLVITDADGNINKDSGILTIKTDEIPYWKVDALYNPEQVAKFKQSNGWEYGFCKE
ncbi:MAG: hypothetical protein ACI4MB_01495 [Candidatus Coproplasma sp.]